MAHLTISSIVVALCLAVGANAFQPLPSRVGGVRGGRRDVTMQVTSQRDVSPKLEEMVGADVETQSMMKGPWDPWKLTGKFELGNILFREYGSMVWPSVEWLRESELKHGRVCMLAFLGIAANRLGLMIPGYLDSKPDDWIDIYKAVLQQHPLAIPQIFAAIGLIEGQTYNDGLFQGTPERPAGNLGFDPLRLYKNKSDAEKKKLELQELKNGRLAMIAMAAFAAERGVDQSVPVLHALGF
ncbi:unnamed protein product [Vitrella brassicaformis CCMP3155]|uniref:Uncharacterized protein n=1 Tax=Vitrella brassicaformis (strain CCMP3155) TaxID=1169540 RepID=A0A0G4EMF1_VITBC|nr:unnamed protein product [Vitrella brassicaformis CCMP3155]|mmetsp:Transcript_30578/g.75914  ORF Transcript_30578/g.75914 Transcript_30578/m.75914 type:complete len:241 (-) Transcript_30578:324-1046(-)|eukprot:CEL98565.1 unnamed protein product [Vitrella brassicaformis CCMP3155]